MRPVLDNAGETADSLVPHSTVTEHYCNLFDLIPLSLTQEWCTSSSAKLIKYHVSVQEIMNVERTPFELLLFFELLLLAHAAFGATVLCLWRGYSMRCLGRPSRMRCASNRIAVSPQRWRSSWPARCSAVPSCAVAMVTIVQSFRSASDA